MSQPLRPPHPATVLVERAPLPATVQRKEAPLGVQKVPHPATVPVERGQHPATVQRKVLPPHTAKGVTGRAPPPTTPQRESPDTVQPFLAVAGAIGAVFTNGVGAIVYYAQTAGRIFISNSGTVVVAAVGAYFFPDEAASVLGGVVVSRSATWLAQRVDERYHVHLADVADRLLDRAPVSVQQAYVRAVQIPARPMVVIHERALHLINESAVSELVAPVVEEIIYRYVGQELLARGMMALGVPRPIAHLISGTIATSLFAGAHDVNPQSQRYRHTLISGIVFGFMMYHRGLPEAMLTHSGNNVAIRLLR